MGRNNTECPTLYLLHILGKRWTVPILENFSSTRIGIQFNDIQISLNGITSKALSESLKELSEADILTKKETTREEFPHTEYFLTEKGVQLQRFIQGAKELGICIYGIDSSCTSRKCSECELMQSKPLIERHSYKYKDGYLAAF